MILFLFFNNHKICFPGSGGVKGFLGLLTVVSADMMLVEALNFHFDSENSWDTL